MSGIKEVTVGYAGGATEFPTYRSIQDHTEAVRVVFDPTVISYRDLLSAFVEMHSPFSPPYSRQYRSAILYHDDTQLETAKEVLAELDAYGKSKRARVYTALEPATDFYRAEEYHQKYIAKSRGR